MDKTDITNVLRDMLREQVCCLGRIVARHQVPADVVWEIVKSLDILYQRACRRIGDGAAAPARSLPPAHRVAPHAGIAHLLEKLAREVSM